MEFWMNEGKSVVITCGGRRYARCAIKTHFVQIGEDYLDLVRTYVLPR